MAFGGTLLRITLTTKPTTNAMMMQAWEKERWERKGKNGGLRECNDTSGEGSPLFPRVFVSCHALRLLLKPLRFAHDDSLV